MQRIDERRSAHRIEPAMLGSTAGMFITTTTTTITTIFIIIATLASSGCSSPALRRATDAASRAGDASYFQGDWAAAAAHYERSVASGIDNGFVFHQLGDCYIRLGRRDEAFDLARRTVDAFTTALLEHGQGGVLSRAPAPRAYLCLGDAHLLLGRGDKARFVFERALRRARSNELDRLGEGEQLAVLRSIAERLGDEDADRDYARRALDAFRAEAKSGRAAVDSVSYAEICTRIARDDAGSARELLEEAQRVSPRHAASGLALAELLRRDRDFARGLEVYQQVLQHAPGDVEALIGAAECALAMNEIAGVERFAQSLPESALDDARVLFLRAEILTRRGENARAIELLAAALAASPADQRPYRRLAGVLIAEGRLSDAAAVCRQASSVFPASSWPLFILAHVYEFQSRDGLAAETWDRFLEKAPSHSRAAFIREKAKRLRGPIEGRDPFANDWVTYQIELP